MFIVPGMPESSSVPGSSTTSTLSFESQILRCFVENGMVGINRKPRVVKDFTNP
jgi:hypothetical protein